jgi:uncharacterized peroxidase-related enzyme
MVEVEEPFSKGTNMNRIAQVDPARATGEAKRLFDAVHADFHRVPNLFRVLGAAPAALEGYLNLCAALAGGRLNARVREQIALTVAESNLCGYCLSAHTFIGNAVGLTLEEITDARRAAAEADGTDAILKLARNVVVQRGEISDADLLNARSAGLSDGEIVETIANVAANIFTNYVNHVARTVVDFPLVKPGDLEEFK